MLNSKLLQHVHKVQTQTKTLQSFNSGLARLRLPLAGSWPTNTGIALWRKSPSGWESALWPFASSPVWPDSDTPPRSRTLRWPMRTEWETRRRSSAACCRSWTRLSRRRLRWQKNAYRCVQEITCKTVIKNHQISHGETLTACFRPRF